MRYKSAIEPRRERAAAVNEPRREWVMPIDGRREAEMEPRRVVGSAAFSEWRRARARRISVIDVRLDMRPSCDLQSLKEPTDCRRATRVAALIGSAGAHGVMASCGCGIAAAASEHVGSSSLPDDDRMDALLIVDAR